MFLVEAVVGLAAKAGTLQADRLDFLGDAANYAISERRGKWRARATTQRALIEPVPEVRTFTDVSWERRRPFLADKNVEAPMTTQDLASTLAKPALQGEAHLLLPEWSATLTTRAGVSLLVRPAAPEDEALLAEFFTHVTADDLQFRFLTGIHKVGHEILRHLVELDHTLSENFLAFAADGETLVATAMLAADATMQRAEVAIATRADFKHKGVGWTLLAHLVDYAKARGIDVIECIESRGNREAITVERDLGFTAGPLPGDPTLTVLTKAL